MHEASFKLRHECPYRTLSEQFPDVTVREWHHHDCQVLEISSAEPADEAFLAAVEDLGEILHVSSGDEGLYLVAQSCECPLDESIIQRFQAHNCVYTPPTVYRQGWEHYTVFGFETGDVHRLLQELDEAREIDVVSKTSIEERRLPHSTLFSVDRLFAGFTDRQLDALRLALDHGYYGQPRGASTAELAERTDVARATFEEHLRKAENKLVLNVEQFVRLLTEPRSEDSLGARAGVPSPVAESD
jgi:predicted DNA binding protein